MSNKLTLLPDGPEVKAALLALIAEARREIRMLFYIFSNDASGVEIRDALLAARARGIRIWLAVDGFGSSDVPDAFFQPLIDAGAAFCRFHPRFGRRYLLRNHQKMLIADGCMAIIGGFNIADPYFDPSRSDSMRDLGLRIDDRAAVAHLSCYFDRLFQWIIAERPTIRALDRLIHDMTQTEGAVRWIFGGPSHRISPYARQIRADLAATSRLQMIMAYFAPNRRMIRLLGRVAQRGEAILITAGKTDVAFARLAAWATYGSLLRQAVRLFEYQPRRLHTKLIVADDVVYIGSANFDMRSLYINLEVMLRVKDAAFAEQARKLFARELAHSKPIKYATYKRLATPLNRLRWRLFYWLFATVDLVLSRRLPN